MSKQELMEEIKLWIDRYSSLFAKVDSKTSMTDGEMSIFREWFKETD